ncbi:MAG: hypothetical protein Q9168_008347 [Polycauliona sp. 1 TL-2023]
MTLTQRNTASRLPPDLDGPIIETIVMNHHNVNKWRNRDPAAVLDVRNLRRLVLAGCRDPILMPWQLYPRDLEALEIVDPVPTYPIEAGLYVSRQQLAPLLSHFHHLKVLKLQNVGAPICEVLFNLRKSGMSLKVLILHDHESSGIDKCYVFKRQHSLPIDCSFDKLLIHLCPNVQKLSLDISTVGLVRDVCTVRQLGSDSVSIAQEPLLEELAEYPTQPLSETLGSLRDLQVLRLVTPYSPITCNSQDVLKTAGKMWSTTLKKFTLVASTPQDEYGVPLTDVYGNGISIPGPRSEWNVMSKRSIDDAGREQCSIFLEEQPKEYLIL